MTQVMLFPPGEKPMNFPDAMSTNVNDGILYFRARKDPNLHTQSSYQTNMPFLLIEDDE
jgi:hypothetical protein